jgi:uncharacterized protein
MQNLFDPLTDQELDRLDDFLLDRIDEDEATEGKDEGILNISTLDGFMTALVSGPRMIPPSQWLPAVWGDFEPVWETEAQFEEILTLMMRHMNIIADTLIEAPDEFEPIFMERELDGKVYTIVDDWCDGHLRGMRLDSQGWSETGDIEPLLGALLLFASEAGWEKLEQMTDEEIERNQNMIAPAVRHAHAYWLERRKNESTLRRGDRGRIRRDDPIGQEVWIAFSGLRERPIAPGAVER